MSKPGIKIFAPASVSNVCVGFDILGFALEKPGDEIIVREGTKPGLTITAIQGGGGKIPLDPAKNTAGAAAIALLESLGESDRPLEMEIHKKMPVGSGMGSSAASATGGVYAVSEFLRTGMSKHELLPFAVKGERINGTGLPADNVAASLLGGMVLIRDNETLDVKKLHIPPGLYAAVIYPHIEILTRESRIALNPEVRMADFIKQSGNLAAFVAAMYTSDIALIGRALQDVLIEPQRAPAIPAFYEMKEKALQAGALGFSISGAGPAMFALCDSSLKAEQVTEEAMALYRQKKIMMTPYLSRINHEGAIRF